VVLKKDMVEDCTCVFHKRVDAGGIECCKVFGHNVSPFQLSKKVQFGRKRNNVGK